MKKIYPALILLLILTTSCTHQNVKNDLAMQAYLGKVKTITRQRYEQNMFDSITGKIRDTSAWRKRETAHFDENGFLIMVETAFQVRINDDHDSLMHTVVKYTRNGKVATGSYMDPGEGVISEHRKEWINDSTEVTTSTRIKDYSSVTTVTTTVDGNGRVIRTERREAGKNGDNLRPPTVSYYSAEFDEKGRQTESLVSAADNSWSIRSRFSDFDATGNSLREEQFADGEKHPSRITISRISYY